MGVGTCNRLILILFYDNNVENLSIIKSVDFQRYFFPWTTYTTIEIKDIFKKIF